MSSRISRTLSIDSSSAERFLLGSGVLLGGDYVAYQKLSGTPDTGYATLTLSAMTDLFPNSVAHPFGLDLATSVSSSSVSSGDNQSITFMVGGTSVASKSGYKSETSWVVSLSNDAITQSTRRSAYKFYFYRAGGIWHRPSNNIHSPLVISAGFYRYDFTATAGSNVVSASVSSSTGYDGDTITYSCVLADGAVFDGWYNGDTLSCADQTCILVVTGKDTTLEARATMPVTTKTLSATYNGAQVSGFPKSVQSAVSLSYGGASKGSIPLSGGTKTFSCGGKIANGAININGTNLNNSGKMMATDVVVTVE